MKRIRRWWLMAAVLAIVVLPSLAGAVRETNDVTVGRNVNITPDVQRQVVEPSIAVDPRNPDTIVAGAADFRLVPPGTGKDSGKGWPGYYRSTDGGKIWSSGLVPGFPGDSSPEGLSSPLRYFVGGGDVQVAFDRSGNLYYSAEVVNETDQGVPIRHSFTQFVAKFANDGRDYVGATIVQTGSGGADYPRIAVDTSGGPNDGNVYVTIAANSGRGAVFTRSTDGGVSFSKPIPIPGSGFPIWSPAVDAAGNVFVLTKHFMKIGAETSPIELLVAKSTDGGLTLGKSVVAASGLDTPVYLPGNEFKTGGIAGIAADVSGVYIVWEDFATGDADVLFVRSTDGGLSWTSPVRVNDVTLGHQFDAAIAVSGGVINVVWYDSRLGQLPNGTITGLDVFYAVSRDLGSSFSENVRVTSVSFDPNLVRVSFFGVFIGDYISIAASPDAVHPIWTDNRNACDNVDPAFGCVDQDVYTATITP